MSPLDPHIREICERVAADRARREGQVNLTREDAQRSSAQAGRLEKMDNERLEQMHRWVLWQDDDGIWQVRDPHKIVHSVEVMPVDKHEFLMTSVKMDRDSWIAKNQSDNEYLLAKIERLEANQLTDDERYELIIAIALAHSHPHGDILTKTIDSAKAKLEESLDPK